jgi:hypothetical protein
MAVSFGTKALGETAGRGLGMIALAFSALQALYYVGDMAALW